MKRLSGIEGEREIEIRRSKSFGRTEIFPPSQLALPNYGQAGTQI